MRFIALFFSLCLLSCKGFSINKGKKSNDLPGVFVIGKYIVHTEKINPQSSDVKRSFYTLLDTVLADANAGDSTYWRVRIYDRRGYEKAGNDSIIEKEPIKKVKISGIKIVITDSNVIKYDSLYHMNVHGANYVILLPDSFINVVSSKMSFFSSGNDKNPDYYKIKLFGNFNLIYGTIGNILMEYNSPYKMGAYSSNSFWCIVKDK